MTATFLTHYRAAFALCLLALACVGAGAAEPATNATNTVAQIPRSVFEIPRSAREGRNPFYPNSTLGMQVPIIQPVSAPEVYSFSLNGITSPPRSTAIINGRTFEKGEEGEVRMSSGARVLVKCEEITTDSATISVNGEKRTIKLRAGL